MPIVINEIEISVVVSDPSSAGSTSTDQSLKEEIIKECVEQVMEILKNKNER